MKFLISLISFFFIIACQEIKNNKLSSKIDQGINKIETGSSLKLCRVSEGAADIYCRFGPTYQWDIAAGQAVVISSGGKVNSLEGDPLTYRFDPEKKNPEFYCIGDVSYDWKSLISSS